MFVINLYNIFNSYTKAEAYPIDVYMYFLKSLALC